MPSYIFKRSEEKPDFLNDIKIQVVFGSIRAKNILLNMFRRILYSKTIESKSKKILVYRIGSFGDTICCLPALSFIKKHFPDADIDILTNAGAKNLVSVKYLLDKSFYREIIDYLDQKPVDVLKRIRMERYDMVIQLPQPQASVRRLTRDMIFFRLAGIRNGFGWQKLSCLLFKKTQEKFLPQKSERAVLVELLKTHGIPTSEEEAFPLYKDADADKKVYDVLIQNEVNIGKSICGIVIGAKRLQNRWPLAYFKQVVSFLRENNYQVLLIGGNDDKSNAESLVETNVFNFCGQFSPIESGALFSHCHFVLTNDTGPMHLAYAKGVTVVALFSSRDFPGRWFPPEKNGNRVFRNDNVSCSLCLSETCSNNICMQAIKPEMVIEHLKTIM